MQQTQTANEPPECYGKIWEERATECSGGYDVGYVGPSGQKVRPRCDWFNACKIKTMLSQTPTRQASLIPPTALVRTMPQPQANPWRSPIQPVPVPGRPGFGMQPVSQQQTTQFGHVVQTAPLQVMPVSYNMPYYLSEPEVRHEDESYWAPLGRELLRGVGKAVGHSISAFFDHVAFKKR